MVNLAAGGAVVEPWRVDELNDEWIHAARVLAEYQRRSRAQQAARRVLDRKSASFRASHPAYRSKQ